MSYLTAAASEVAKKNGQKTLNASHVEAALESIGFGEWEQELHARQTKYASQSHINDKKHESAEIDEDIEISIVGDDATTTNVDNQQPLNGRDVDREDDEEEEEEEEDTIDNTQPMNEND